MTAHSLPLPLEPPTPPQPLEVLLLAPFLGAYTSPAPAPYPPTLCSSPVSLRSWQNSPHVSEIAELPPRCTAGPTSSPPSLCSSAATGGGGGVGSAEAPWLAEGCLPSASVLISSSYKDSNQVGSGSTPETPLCLRDLVKVSKDSHIRGYWGLWLQHTDKGGTQCSPELTL